MTRAEILALAKLREFELRRAGVVIPSSDRPLSEVIGEYKAELERKGDSKMYVRDATRLLHKLVAETGPTLETWTTETISRALGKLWPDKARTQNKARTAARGLSKMLVDRDELVRNPVDRIKRARVVRKRLRRPLADEELRAVIGVAPIYRSVVYVTAVNTGLRKHELKTRTIGDVDLERAVISIEADAAKNRQAATLHLPKIAVKFLRLYIRSLGPREKADRLFKMPAISTWKKDLIRAGVEYRTPRGLADFHALRTTFITNLFRRNKRTKTPPSSKRLAPRAVRNLRKGSRP